MPPGAILTIADGRLRLGATDAADHERTPIDIFFSSLARRSRRIRGRGRSVRQRRRWRSWRQGDQGIWRRDHGAGERWVGARIRGNAGQRHRERPGRFRDPRRRDGGKTRRKSARSFERSFGRSLRLRNANPTTISARRRGAAKAICAILRVRTGHDFSGYKTRTFMRRVHRRMQIRQCEAIADYVELLREDPDEATLLFRDLLINVTSFFRDADAFDALEKPVIPRLFEGQGRVRLGAGLGAGLRHGRGSLFHRHPAARTYGQACASPPRVTIFATDIDEAALAIARAGRYPEALMDGRLARATATLFHRASPAAIVVAKEVRDLCVFSPHSMLRDPPFSRMDLDLLPQSADLFRRGSAEASDSDLSLRACSRGVSVSRHVRDRLAASPTYSRRSTRSIACSRPATPARRVRMPLFVMAGVRAFAIPAHGPARPRASPAPNCARSSRRASPNNLRRRMSS